MYKEYRFQDKTKAAKKLQQLQNTYGYKFPVYDIQLKEKKFLSIVYPLGLQPNPRRKKQ